MDCSNAQHGITPLNTETTKQLGIARFQTVILPNLREFVTEWEQYRRTNDLEWSDMWMFKADISNCFNQLHWHAPHHYKIDWVYAYFHPANNAYAYLRLRSGSDTHDMGRYRRRA
jgi:hypothetical protein